VSTKGPSRKQARRDALFLLYQREVTDLSMEALVKGQRLREGYGPDEFTMRSVTGVAERRAEIDDLLARHAARWPLGRIAPLERSALRLAVWELLEGTPPEVAIDEAVRLTRRYSTDEAGAFVNGILGAVQQELEGRDG
jgi:N utilization substance protein B